MRDSRELGARFIENPACALAAVDQHLRSTSSLARVLVLVYAHQRDVSTHFPFSCWRLNARAKMLLGCCEREEAHLHQRGLLLAEFCNTHHGERQSRTRALCPVAYQQQPCPLVCHIPPFVRAQESCSNSGGMVRSVGMVWSE